MTPGDAETTLRQGFFWRLDGRLGTYGVSHPVLDLTVAEPGELSFGLLERLGVLTAGEARFPHSVLLGRSTTFASTCRRAACRSRATTS
jgi:hypothetical protein